MRLVLTGILLTALGSFTALGDWSLLNPPGLHGLVPWNGSQVSAQKHDGRWVAAFTGGKNKQTAIYLRSFDPQGRQWSNVEPVSPIDGKSDSQPSLLIDSEGTYHCVWTTLQKSRSYQTVYARRPAGAEAWSAPRVLSEGRGFIPAHLLIDEEENLFVYYSNNSLQAPRSRIFVFVSHDHGVTWRESDPGFPAENRKGKANHPQAALLRDGAFGLVWLDQSPGGVSVVFNRAEERGTGWFSQPVAVNSDRSYAARHPRILAVGERIHVLWTVPWLGKDGPKTAIWSAHSLDQGRNFSHNQLVYEVDGDCDQVELFAADGKVGMVWTERGMPRADRAPGGGRINEMIFWDGQRYLDTPEVEEVATSDEYFFSDLKVFEREGARIILASDLNPFKPTRVRILSKLGEGNWETTIATAKTSGYDARDPMVFAAKSDPVYIIVFHEVRRRQFIMEPAPWETNILWGQYQFQPSAGATR